MILYHVTRKKYNVGDIITTDNFDNEYSYYHVNSPLCSIDIFLDEAKPDSEPSRKKCIYAFETLAHCAAFIGRDHDAFNFYKVELNSEVSHLMCLTDAIRKTTNIRTLDIIRKEYWYPTKGWNFR